MDAAAQLFINYLRNGHGTTAVGDYFPPPVCEFSRNGTGHLGRHRGAVRRPLRMRLQNGCECLRMARSRSPSLKILYATGYARNAIVHHGLLDADVQLLPKPFTVDALGRKIRDVLQQ